MSNSEPLAASTHFNPRSPHGERRIPVSTVNRHEYFNPRSPHGERHEQVVAECVVLNFNPRSPHGERRAPLTLVWPWEAFQSTLPARGATGAPSHPAR